MGMEAEWKPAGLVELHPFQASSLPRLQHRLVETWGLANGTRTRER